MDDNKWISGKNDPFSVEISLVRGPPSRKKEGRTIDLTTLFYFLGPWLRFTTPRKINIEPENDGLGDDFPFPGVYSQVPC